VGVNFQRREFQNIVKGCVVMPDAGLGYNIGGIFAIVILVLLVDTTNYTEPQILTRRYQIYQCQ
jgi:hypothetical protein